MILTKDIERNIELITNCVPNNTNFKKRHLKLKGDIKCTILFISGIAKKDEIEEFIIKPLLFRVDCDLNNLPCAVSYIADRYIAISDIEINNNIDYLAEGLKSGKTILLIDNQETAIISNTYKSNYRNTAESKIEETIRGGRSAFVETLGINISLIQEKLKNNNLKIEKYVLGEENNCDAALIYVNNKIEKDVLNKLKKSLSTIKNTYIPNTGYLVQLIDKDSFNVFPHSKTTEKPDKVIADILQGKAAILMNGCSFAVILPVVFIEFFQSIEDYSNRLILANFDRFLRLLAFIIIISLSPIYLVLLNYNSQFIPLNLIKIIIMSRKDIPLPPFLEIILMELIVEFLREGGLRLPSLVGQTLSIVGGIILGSSAIEAGIVSPTTLVVVAVTVISTFLIPNYEMSLSIRLLRFYVLILAQILGFLGVIIGLFSITAYLMNQESVGIPYFSPFAPVRQKDLKDSIIRVPLKYLNKIPVTFKKRRVENKKNE